MPVRLHLVVIPIIFPYKTQWEMRLSPPINNLNSRRLKYKLWNKTLPQNHGMIESLNINVTVLIQDCMSFHFLKNVPANKILLINEFLMYFGAYFLAATKDTLGKLKYRAISLFSSTNIPIHLYALNKIGFCCCCLFYSAYAVLKIKLN